MVLGAPVLNYIETGPLLPVSDAVKIDGTLHSYISHLQKVEMFSNEIHNICLRDLYISINMCL